MNSDGEYTDNEESNESNEDNEHVANDDILSLYLNNFSEDDEDDTDFVEPTNVEANETENDEEEDKMGDVEFDIEEMSALQKDLQDILAEGEADVYTQFLGSLNEKTNEENSLLAEEDSSDVDYNYQQTREPNEEFRSDPGVRISGTFRNFQKIYNSNIEKEVDTLLRDERGEPPQPPVRRGRKRSLHGTILANTNYAPIMPKEIPIMIPLVQLRPVSPVQAEEGAMTVEQITQLYEQLNDVRLSIY
jgi:hypothetical protein